MSSQSNSTLTTLGAMLLSSGVGLDMSGFEFTGEVRKPRKGDFFLSGQGVVQQASINYENCEFDIMRPKPSEIQPAGSEDHWRVPKKSESRRSLFCAMYSHSSISMPCPMP